MKIAFPLDSIHLVYEAYPIGRATEERILACGKYAVDFCSKRGDPTLRHGYTQMEIAKMLNVNQSSITKV